MRIPYLQLGEKFIATEAPMVAAMTGLDLDSTIGKGVRLFAFVIDKTSTAEKPPDGVLMFPEAIAVIEGIMGWTGTPGRLAEALITAGTIERLEVGIRVRGCDRYKATWEKNRRRPKPTGRNRTGTGPEPDRLSAGTAPKPGRETETETEKEKLPSEAEKRSARIPPAPATTPPRSAAEHVPARVETDRPSSDLSEALEWAARAHEAYEAAFPRSVRVPQPSGAVLAFWRGARKVLADKQRPLAELDAAWAAFLRHDHWSTRDQPCPWDAWVKRWTEFLPGQVPPGAMQRGKGLAPVRAESVDWSKQENGVFDGL